MSPTALIVAAGRGERAGGGLPKQYRSLAGKPVLTWSARAFATAKIDTILVAAAPEHADLARRCLADFPHARVIEGGASRTESVRNGLAAAAETGPEAVFIHDAARPGLRAETIEALLRALERADGAAPALPAADALKRGADGLVTANVDRAGLYRVQTPQAFRFEAIMRAYQGAGSASYDDDIAVAQAAGLKIALIPGDARLMKLTFPEDFAMLEPHLGGPKRLCVGTGYDAHRFGEGDFVTLCGVRIPHTRGLAGHSDADAGWHALVDAILGALGEGDIGKHFPPSEARWKGADSEIFLRRAVELAAGAGARIHNVDITLICERPKIGPHREAMRARTAEVLGVPIAFVSVKATTTERMGFTGREEGLAAQAAISLERPAAD